MIYKNNYIKRNNYYDIEIYNKNNSGIVKIDLNNYEIVSKYRWRLEHDRTIGGKKIFYVISSSSGKKVRLHRLLTNAKKGDIVDHINRDTLDNRRNNLSIGTSLDNNKNKSKCKRNKSGRTGVYSRTKKNTLYWVGEFAHNSKRKQKWFSTNKYGYDKVFNMAVKFIEDAEIKYNIKNEK